MEYIAVEFFIFLFCTVIGVFCPQRSCLVNWLRTFLFLLLIFQSNIPVFILLLFRWFHIYDVFFFFQLLGVLIFKIDWYRHEGTVFFQNFSAAVFIGEFKTVIVEIQGNRRTSFLFISLDHIELCSAVTFPMDRDSIFFI